MEEIKKETTEDCAVKGLTNLGINENEESSITILPKRLEEHKNISKHDLNKLKGINTSMIRKGDIIFIKYCLKRYVADGQAFIDKGLKVVSRSSQNFALTDMVRVLDKIDDNNFIVRFVSNRECHFENKTFIIDINDIWSCGYGNNRTVKVTNTFELISYLQSLNINNKLVNLNTDKKGFIGKTIWNKFSCYKFDNNPKYKGLGNIIELHADHKFAKEVTVGDLLSFIKDNRNYFTNDIFVNISDEIYEMVSVTYDDDEEQLFLDFVVIEEK